MPDPSLAKKMKRKPGSRAALINPPAGYEAAAFPGFEPAASSLSGQFDWIQIFVQNKSELDKLAPRCAKALKPEAIFWISFPKGSSKIQSDLTRDQGWEAIRPLELKWINLISVSETWSAFALRKYKPGEAKQNFR